MGSIEMVTTKGLFVPMDVVYYVGILAIVIAAIASFHFVQKYILKEKEVSKNFK